MVWCGMWRSMRWRVVPFGAVRRIGRVSRAVLYIVVVAQPFGAEREGTCSAPLSRVGPLTLTIRSAVAPGGAKASK